MLPIGQKTRARMQMRKLVRGRCTVADFGESFMSESPEPPLSLEARSRTLAESEPPSIASAIRPATMKRTAAASRTVPEGSNPPYFFSSHAVSGQAETPEQRANHPFVGGHGPF